jgi:hypothetical protein
VAIGAARLEASDEACQAIGSAQLGFPSIHQIGNNRYPELPELEEPMSHESAGERSPASSFTRSSLTSARL